MQKAIGLIEFKSIASGITATDKMVKTADVELLEAQAVCPGKYIALICGSLSAVKAAVEAGRNTRSEDYIDSFLLGNPDEAIFPAIYGCVENTDIHALGILETYDVASIIVAADIAAKTAAVQLLELRLAKGLCGKSFLLLTGEVAACEAAIAKAKKEIADTGMFLSDSVIAHPDERLIKTIV